jgi:hypothetical protein
LEFLAVCSDPARSPECCVRETYINVNQIITSSEKNRSASGAIKTGALRKLDERVIARAAAAAKPLAPTTHSERLASEDGRKSDSVRPLGFPMQKLRGSGSTFSTSGKRWFPFRGNRRVGARNARLHRLIQAGKLKLMTKQQMRELIEAQTCKS